MDLVFAFNDGTPPLFQLEVNTVLDAARWHEVAPLEAASGAESLPIVPFLRDACDASNSLQCPRVAYCEKNQNWKEVIKKSVCTRSTAGRRVSWQHRDPLTKVIRATPRAGGVCAI